MNGRGKSRKKLPGAKADDLVTSHFRTLFVVPTKPALEKSGDGIR